MPKNKIVKITAAVLPVAAMIFLSGCFNKAAEPAGPAATRPAAQQNQKAQTGQPEAGSRSGGAGQAAAEGDEIDQAISDISASAEGEQELISGEDADKAQMENDAEALNNLTQTYEE